MLVDNYRPGILARMGFDEARLKALKPDLVYCNLNGYGMSDTDANASNGAGCLAATIIGKLKAASGIGGIYVYPAGSRDCGEEYTYSIHARAGRPIRFVVTDYDGATLFDGTPDDFDAAAIKG